MSRSVEPTYSGLTWAPHVGFFVYKHEEFLARYHLRSNVETAFSAIKRLLGPSVRSKLFVAQVNEVLCKVLCYNLTVLVHAMYELGIEDPTFAAPKLPALPRLQGAA